MDQRSAIGFSLGWSSPEPYGSDRVPRDMRVRLISKGGLSLCLAVGLVATSGSICLAEVVRLDLDPDRTAISFSLPATLHAVNGTMRLERGFIAFEAATGRAQGEVVVSSRSAATGHKGRDRVMHRKVLDSDRFPSMVFYPETVKGSLVDGETVDLVVEGSIELQGELHPIVWLTRVEREADHLSVGIKFDVPYVEWGLTDPSKLLLRVGRVVHVGIHAQGTLSKR